MPLTVTYPIEGHPLLSGKYTGLKTQGEKDSNYHMAEMLLGLVPPPYTGEKAERLVYAIVLQVNFQLEHGLTPEIVKSVSNTHPGMATTYRDRYVSPVAWDIVRFVTGRTTVGFTPPGIGV